MTRDTCLINKTKRDWNLNIQLSAPIPAGAVFRFTPRSILSGRTNLIIAVEKWEYCWRNEAFQAADNTGHHQEVGPDI